LLYRAKKRFIPEVVAGAGLVSASSSLRPSVRRELVALAQSARGIAVLDLQTKNVPLARFLYIFSLQVMSTGSEHRRIEGSNADPRLKRQNPAIGGVCCFGCGGRIPTLANKTLLVVKHTRLEALELRWRQRI